MGEDFLFFLLGFTTIMKCNVASFQTSDLLMLEKGTGLSVYYFGPKTCRKGYGVIYVLLLDLIYSIDYVQKVPKLYERMY